MIRLTLSIGKSADGIIDEVWWNTVIKELNEISKDFTDGTTVKLVYLLLSL